MNIYIEYEILRDKYHEAQDNYDKILERKQELFNMTQPASIATDKEKTTGGERKNVFDTYLIRKEKERIDERLKEARDILSDRRRLLDEKQSELSISKGLYDRIYYSRYIERMKVDSVAESVGYSRQQVYRILRKIEENMGKARLRSDRIVKRECDVPMASKKGLLPCDKQCKGCIACIEWNEEGERQHTPDRKEHR